MWVTKYFFFKHKGIMEELPACQKHLNSLDGPGLDTKLYFGMCERKREKVPTSEKGRVLYCDPCFPYDLVYKLKPD